MNIYPPSFVDESRTFELQLSVFQVGNQYASGFSMILPEEIDREDFVAVIDALKATITSLEKVVDRL